VAFVCSQCRKTLHGDPLSALSLRSPQVISISHRLAEESVVKNPIAQKAATAAASVVVNETLAKYSLSSTAEPHDDNDDIESSLNNKSDIEALNLTPEETEELKKWSRLLRLCFIICAALMITAGVLSLSSASLSNIFIALYIIFFGSLICCFELAFVGVSRWIAQNFGFLYTKLGRVLFLFFIAFLCYGLGLFGIIVMCLLIVGLGGNFYVWYRCPKYETWIRIQHFKNMTNK
jgi:hypothetical protein